jgi:hypothetical protein
VAYEVTLDDYRPAPRGDGRPWTQALIEEAAVSTGPWTPIETQPLSPIDPNPADPIYLIEATFFSEQIGSDKSPYQEFKDLYDGSMADLRADLGLGTGTGGGGTTAGRQFFGTVRLVP